MFKSSDFLESAAIKFGIPGVAVGVWVDGREAYACYGVTSVENPLPVDRDTSFLVGSVTKTFTATALMHLVSEGRVDLESRVRQYVPELVLADERAAEEITVLELLNHTAGLDWGLITDTGEGDDALAKYVAKMAALPLVAPRGARSSYSQAGYNLAGRIVEKVTGLTFERAVTTLLIEPLGLSHSFFARDDVMTRRFAVGHNRAEDGTLSVARLWRRARGDNPGGGLVSSAADQLRWARFHLGDGRAENGVAVLPVDSLHRMKEPTVELRGTNLGDAMGIGWFLRDVDGARTIGHAGSANGQFAELLLLPERDFAVVSMSNAGPNGIPLNQAVVRWALETYAGVIDRDPKPVPYDEARTREVVGDYENEVMTLSIRAKEAGQELEVRVKPEIRSAADKELPPDHSAFDFGFLPGDRDEYVITSGAFLGLRGFFSRGDTGAVAGVDLAGRVFRRRFPRVRESARR